MGKKAIVLVVVIVVLIVGTGIVLATRSSNNSGSDMNGMDMNSSQDQTGSSSKPVATDAVTIQSFAFSPANITVKKGTTVTWTNRDSTTHTVTETDGKAGPNSSGLQNGKSFSFTYDTVGTFRYDCSIHPNMVGTVTVTE